MFFFKSWPSHVTCNSAYISEELIIALKGKMGILMHCKDKDSED